MHWLSLPGATSSTRSWCGGRPLWKRSLAAGRRRIRVARLRPTAALVLAALVTGCAVSGGPPADADTELNAPNDPAHRLLHDGQPREYLLYVPANAITRSPLPLLVSLHDAGSDAAAHRQQTGFDALASAAGFAVAYPQAWRAKAARAAAWNTGACCGDAGLAGIDDVGFIRALVETIAAQLPIDRDRVYVVGLGQGAMLAHRLAQELALQFAAVAAVAGTPARADFDTAASLPLLQMHSADDPVAPYDGGRATLPGLRGKVPQAGVETTLRRWVQANHCAKSPKVRRDIVGALGTATAGQRASLYYHPDCRDQQEVALWRLDGLGHGWPGGWEVQTGGRGTTKRNDIIDASREIWLWLSRFQRKQAAVPHSAGNE